MTQNTNDPNRPDPTRDPNAPPGGGEADRNRPGETEEQRKEREKREREQKK